ncbi:hypothetical protein V2J09_023855 [Rumex salicifolius]
MELLYDLFVYAFTAVVLSFLVSKLISSAIGSGDVSGGKEPCGGGGVVGEGSLEKSLKVEDSKSLKKRRKKISGETVLVSEFKGETEPAIADESLVGLLKADDDRKELASSERNPEFLETDVSEACFADQLLSAGGVGGVESSVIRTDAPAENEGLISSSEITLNERVVEKEGKEVGCPAEGFEHEINSGNDLEKSVVNDRRTDYKEYDMVGEELGGCEFSPKEEAESVGHGDQELVHPNERREFSGEPKFDDFSDVGLLSGKNAVDNQHEHLRILKSLEMESKVCTEYGYVDQVDDRIEELRSSGSKEDVINCDQEGVIGDPGTERSEPKIIENIHVGLLGGENAVDHHHKHFGILDSLESAVKDGTQGGYVDEVDDLNDVIRNEEGSTGNEGIVEMEISDGEEWEGIERNELERDFAKAMNFVECGSKDGQLSTLGSDVTMQFYGLQKVSMEGPCHESPPMALKLSARAKWNAWQKLGSMIPEEAMEKYINLLSEKVPGWMGEHPFVEEGKLSSEEDGACSSLDANISSTLTVPLTCIDESKSGEDPVMRAGDITGNSSSVSKDEE